MSEPSEPTRLSVVIPAYNEAARIAEGLRAARAWLDLQPWTSELVLVDDGSTDGTARIAAGLGLGGLRVERLRQNAGKGAALRHGVERAHGAVILTSDADFSTPLREVERVFEALDRGADLVIASREHPGTRIPQDQHPVRKTLGRLFNRWVRLLTGLPFADTQCGFKGFRGEVARRLYRRMRINGFATDVELLVLARREGLRIVEIPVEWSHAAQSRVRLWRHPLQMARDVIRIRLRAGGRGEWGP